MRILLLFDFEFWVVVPLHVRNAHNPLFLRTDLRYRFYIPTGYTATNCMNNEKF
jgi:hypothetical protein